MSSRSMAGVAAGTPSFTRSRSAGAGLTHTPTQCGALSDHATKCHHRRGRIRPVLCAVLATAVPVMTPEPYWSDVLWLFIAGLGVRAWWSDCAPRRAGRPP